MSPATCTVLCVKLLLFVNFATALVGHSVSGAAVEPPPKYNEIEKLLWLPPSSNGMSASMQTSPDGPAFNSAASVAMVTNAFSANVMGDSAPGINSLASPRAREAGENTVNLQAQAAMQVDALLKGQNPKFSSSRRSKGAALEAEEKRAAATAAVTSQQAAQAQAVVIVAVYQFELPGNSRLLVTMLLTVCAHRSVQANDAAAPLHVKLKLDSNTAARLSDLSAHASHVRLAAMNCRFRSRSCPAVGQLSGVRALKTYF